MFKLREFLGVADVLRHLSRLETAMAKASEEIRNLAGRIDDVSADFRAFRDAMQSERDNLTEAGQAELDKANAKLAALDAEVGDADGSDAAIPEAPAAGGEAPRF